MKKILALSAAALLSTSMIAAPALAQVSVDVGGSGGVSVGGSTDSGSGSVGVDAGGGANVGVSGDGVKLGAEADTDANAELDNESTAAIGGTFDGALSAMTRAGEAAGSIGAMTEVSSVNVIKVDGMADANMEAFAKAETDNQASIDELRASLDANAAVKAALDAQSVNSGDVVAASVNADGSLTVFVR